MSYAYIIVYVKILINFNNIRNDNVINKYLCVYMSTNNNTRRKKEEMHRRKRKIPNVVVASAFLWACAIHLPLAFASGKAHLPPTCFSCSFSHHSIMVHHQ